MYNLLRNILSQDPGIGPSVTLHRTSRFGKWMDILDVYIYISLTIGM